jgi:hypothetical protein
MHEGNCSGVAVTAAAEKPAVKATQTQRVTHQPQHADCHERAPVKHRRDASC